MTPYKVIALDLDGTLLNDDKEISQDNLEWIQKAHDAGIHIVLATGRGLPRVTEFLPILNVNPPLVLANGGEIWKEHGKLLKRHFLRRESVRELHRISEEYATWFWLYGADGFVHKPEFQPEMLGNDWVKFGFSYDDISILEEIRDRISKFDDLEITQSHQSILEISFKGVHKASGLASVCEYLGVDRDKVIAMGDNANDIKMLRWAGLGVAMANGEEITKEAANVVTLSNEEDGVAWAIRRYVFEA